MATQQHTKLRFNPMDGDEVQPNLWGAREWRMYWPGHPWNYNPWTGEHRDQRDIESDPGGMLIIPSGEPIYAGEQYGH